MASPSAAAAEAAEAAVAEGPSFFEFPVDVQLRILSFLDPPDLSSFAQTSRGASSLLSRRDLHISLCARRWGSVTQISLWPPFPSPLLYRCLFRLQRFLGFWRRVSPSTSHSPLLLFHWAPSSLSASTISPSPDALGGVSRSPFLWSGVTWGGEPVSFLRVGERAEEEAVLGELSFMGEGHVFVEERRDRCIGEEEKEAAHRLLGSAWRLVGGATAKAEAEGELLPLWRMTNRIRRSWETQHLVKVPNPCPTPSRPLQGLWKGVCENMKLEFFLVTYDDIGGIACRHVGDTLERFSSHSPVFWTSSCTFMEPPFSREEEDMYESREHILPNCFGEEEETVSHILCINSSYDLVIPDVHTSSHDPCNAEGRIWVYQSGNFGFGFLRNNFVVDMKPIAVANGNMLMLL